MNIGADFKKSMYKPINTSAVSILGLFTLGWGAWVASPFWHVFDSAKMFQYMAFLPEWLWGVVAIAAGLAIIYGAVRRSYRSLITGATIGALHWFMISMLYFAGDWQNTGGITVAAFALYSAFVRVNLKVNRNSIDSS